MARTLKPDTKSTAPDLKKKGKANGKEAAASPPAPGQAAATPTAGHNAEVRAAIMRTAFKDIYDIQAEIAHLTELHIAPLREALRKRREQLRTDLDAKSADLAPYYAIYKRDRELGEFDDEHQDEAARSQDMMREAWQALAHGETLDFLQVLDGGAAANAQPTGGGTFNEMQAEATGEADGRQGKRTNAALYEKDAKLSAAYDRGYMRGTAANLPAAAPAAEPVGAFGPN